MRIMTLIHQDSTGTAPELIISTEVNQPVLAHMTVADMKAVSRLFTTIILDELTHRAYVKPEMHRLLKERGMLNIVFDKQNYEIQGVDEASFLEMVSKICEIAKSHLPKEIKTAPAPSKPPARADNMSKA